MSGLLAQLLAKRHQLRPAETIVRYADGSRERVRLSGSDGRTADRLESAAHGFVVDTAPDTIPACVLGGWLYLGSQDAVGAELSELYGITHVLSVGVEAPPIASLWRTLFVPCLDLAETRLADVLALTDAFIGECRQMDGRILVHCNAGVSRSAAVVVGYFMRTERLSYADALALVRAQRPCCRPNDGFAKQLKEMEMSSGII